MLRLPIIPVSDLTKRTDYFHCEHMRADLSARSCVANQQSRADERKHCRLVCLVGAEVRRRTEDGADLGPEPERRRVVAGCWNVQAILPADPHAKCPCGKSPQGVRARNGRKDLAHLCIECRKLVLRAEDREKHRVRRVGGT